MSRIILVRSLPPADGQTVGGGYEKSGLSRAPGTFSKKRVSTNPETGVKDTGMLYEVDNPWYKEKSSDSFLSRKKIYKWEEMEKKLGIRTDDPDYNVPPNQENPTENFYSKSLAPNSRFWIYYRVKLEAGSNPFNMDNPKEELAILVLKATKEVLPTISMRGAKGYHRADFYIEDIEAEAELKMTQSESKIQATEEYTKLSTDMRRRIGRILGVIKSGNPSDKVVSAHLFDYIDSKEENRQAFLRVLSKTPENILAHDEFLQAKETGVIQRKDGKFYRILPDGKLGRQLGADEQMCIQFLLEPENVEFRDELREAIKSVRNKQSIV